MGMAYEPLTLPKRNSVSDILSVRGHVNLRKAINSSAYLLYLYFSHKISEITERFEDWHILFHI
jgi:hypothetical protein